MAYQAVRPRPLRFRIVALILATLFLLVGARESVAGYSCIRHSDHGEHGAAGHHGATAQAPTDHGVHAGHDAHAAPDQSAEAPPEPCSCIGECAVGEIVSDTDAYPGAHVVYSYPPTVRLVLPAAALPGAPDFLLPYSNAPPLIG